jgi:hypothetical protein
MWDRVIAGLLEIEKKDIGAGRPRDEVRAAAIDSLKLVIKAVRQSLRLRALAEHDVEGIDDFMNVVALRPFPTPLYLLMFELMEVQAKRPSCLFSQPDSDIGEGPYNFFRRQAKAFAAAALHVLMENGLMLAEAAGRIADTLNNCKFANPTGDSYSWETVKDWRKDRKKLKDGFEDNFKNYCLDLRGSVGRAKAARMSKQEVQELLLFRLANYLEAIAYR